MNGISEFEKTYKEVALAIIARDNTRQIVSMLKGIYRLLWGIADALDVFDDEDETEESEQEGVGGQNL